MADEHSPSNFLKCQYQAYLQLKYLHLNMVPMTLYNDCMPDFNEQIHVYGF